MSKQEKKSISTIEETLATARKVLAEGREAFAADAMRFCAAHNVGDFLGNMFRIENVVAPFAPNDAAQVYEKPFEGLSGERLCEVYMRRDGLMQKPNAGLWNNQGFPVRVESELTREEYTKPSSGRREDVRRITEHKGTLVFNVAEPRFFESLEWALPMWAERHGSEFAPLNEALPEMVTKARAVNTMRDRVSQTENELRAAQIEVAEKIDAPKLLGEVAGISHAHAFVLDTQSGVCALQISAENNGIQAAHQAQTALKRHGFSVQEEVQRQDNIYYEPSPTESGLLLRKYGTPITTGFALRVNMTDEGVFKTLEDAVRQTRTATLEADEGYKAAGAKLQAEQRRDLERGIAEAFLPVTGPKVTD